MAESWFYSLYMVGVTSDLDDFSHLPSFHQMKGNVHAELAAKDGLKIILIFCISRQHAKTS